MTFLPIIGRELRVRARHPATYWTRLVIAFVGAFLCVQQLIVRGPLNTPGQTGRIVFDEITFTAFLLCCGACLLGAEAISSERREGTLGLLFLTRVRGLDVVAGKLASVGATSLCALTGLLPALMIPMLGGGVSPGEAARKAAGLLATLLFALGAGLCGAAAQPRRFRAACGALLIVVLTVLGPVLLGKGCVRDEISVPSPLFLITVAGDSYYQAAPGFFWSALATVPALGGLLLLWAAFRLRGSVGHDGGAEVVRPPPSAEKQKREVGFLRWRPDKEEAGPVEWLAYRQQGVNVVLWATAVVALAFSRWVSLAGKPVGGGGATPLWLLLWPLGVAAAAVGGALVAWVAGRFFANARRTGDLELLLPTPVGAESVVEDQWRVLKRTFVWPVFFLQVATLVPIMGMTGVRSAGFSANMPLESALTALLSFANTYLGTGALCWLALWFGLAARRQVTGVFYAVGLAQGVPWLASLVVLVLSTAVSGPFGRPLPVPYAVVSWLPEAVICLFNIGLFRLAQRGVAGSLAAGEPLRFEMPRSISTAAQNALGALWKARHWTPS
jgi:hypothetical protein